jgi:sortase A
MTVTDHQVEADAEPRRRPSAGVLLLRFVGWLLIIAGGVVLLYLVYSLFFTNLGTNAAQADLLERWELDVDEAEGEGEGEGEESPVVGDADAGDEETSEGEASEGEAEVTAGGAVAVLQFRRPGSDEPPVHADPLFVVGGVTLADLTRGPGHYPGTALPGEDGNFAVAGHRTTYGAPFYHLDQLTDGDEIIVTDRNRRSYTYRFIEQRIVNPGDSSVLGSDPLGNGRPLLTLTTCHPRFSARQRMIVFAELVEDAA